MNALGVEESALTPTGVSLNSSLGRAVSGMLMFRCWYKITACESVLGSLVAWEPRRNEGAGRKTKDIGFPAK